MFWEVYVLFDALIKHIIFIFHYTIYLRLTFELSGWHLKTGRWDSPLE
jgi:hypothetical protein